MPRLTGGPISWQMLLATQSTGIWISNKHSRTNIVDWKSSVVTRNSQILKWICQSVTRVPAKSTTAQFTSATSRYLFIPKIPFPLIEIDSCINEKMMVVDTLGVQAHVHSQAWLQFLILDWSYEHCFRNSRAQSSWWSKSMRSETLGSDSDISRLIHAWEGRWKRKLTAWLSLSFS
jgi:hypothetical protein